MIDLLAPEDDAATPLTREESQGLLLSYISLRSELNAAEQENIAEASERARRRKFVLDETYLNRLHGEMFGRVWDWAGRFRTTDKNLGVPHHRVATDFRQLLDDCRYHLENKTYPPDELAARFHHRLVFVHPYPNGNGRHARLATDLLLESLDHKAFTWGSASGIDGRTTRQRYVDALKAADGHDYRPLFAFVRS